MCVQSGGHTQHAENQTDSGAGRRGEQSESCGARTSPDQSLRCKLNHRINPKLESQLLDFSLNIVNFLEIV